MTQPKYWIAIHSHRHGSSVYLVKSKRRPKEAALIEACKIDFEEDHEENIELHQIDIEKPDADLDSLLTGKNSEAKIQRVIKELFKPDKRKLLHAACDSTAHNPKLRFNPRKKKLTPKTMARIAAGARKYIK